MDEEKGLQAFLLQNKVEDFLGDQLFESILPIFGTCWAGRLIIVLEEEERGELQPPAPTLRLRSPSYSSLEL